MRIGGDKFDEAIISYVKKHFNLLIGERTAEQIKINLGSAFPIAEIENSYLDIKGRNLSSGLPKNVTITGSEVREALLEPIAVIVDAIRTTLEKTPPELSADIIDFGITLTGGGALLRGLDALISRTDRHARKRGGQPARLRGRRHRQAAGNHFAKRILQSA